MVEWSGQDVITNIEPNFAKMVTNEMSEFKIWPQGVYGMYRKFNSMLCKISQSALFENAMTLCVLINTVVLALDRYGIEPEEEEVLDDINNYLTYIFIGEMGFHLISIGPILYLSDKMNYLDGSVVILSILEMTLFQGLAGGAVSAFRTIRIFRTFRVLRVARLLKSMRSMQMIMAVIVRAMGSFIYLAALLILFTFIYALLGMQLFGNRFDFEDGVPRLNFASFNQAFITSFVLLTMENWQVLLFDCMRSSQIKFVSAGYLISWIFIGNFMLLNLFLAILLDAFSEEDEEEREEEEGKKNQILDKELEGEPLIENLNTFIDYAGGGKKKKNAFV